MDVYSPAQHYTLLDLHMFFCELVVYCINIADMCLMLRSMLIHSQAHSCSCRASHCTTPYRTVHAAWHYTYCCILLCLECLVHLQGPTWGLAQSGEPLHGRLRPGKCIHLLLPAHLCNGHARIPGSICLHGRPVGTRRPVIFRVGFTASYLEFSFGAVTTLVAVILEKFSLPSVTGWLCDGLAHVALIAFLAEAAVRWQSVVFRVGFTASCLSNFLHQS